MDTVDLLWSCADSSALCMMYREDWGGGGGMLTEGKQNFCANLNFPHENLRFATRASDGGNHNTTLCSGLVWEHTDVPKSSNLSWMP